MIHFIKKVDCLANEQVVSLLALQDLFEAKIILSNNSKYVGNLIYDGKDAGNLSFIYNTGTESKPKANTFYPFTGIKRTREYDSPEEAYTATVRNFSSITVENLKFYYPTLKSLAF